MRITIVLTEAALALAPKGTQRTFSEPAIMSEVEMAGLKSYCESQKEIIKSYVLTENGNVVFNWSNPDHTL